MVSGPIIEDKLLGRIAVSTRQTDGFYENIFTNQDDVVDYLEDTSVRGRLIWNVSDDLSLDFRAGYSRSRPARSTSTPFSIPAFVDAFGAPNYDAGSQRRRLPVYLQHAGHQRAGDLDFALKADWALGFADLVASVAYNDLEEYLLSDGTAATFYGYELTPACQAGRAELNSFTRPDLFGEPFNPFGVLPPGRGLPGRVRPLQPADL
jgi:iron complex outermembrane receptor protein